MMVLNDHFSLQSSDKMLVTEETLEMQAMSRAQVSIMILK